MNSSLLQKNFNSVISRYLQENDRNIAVALSGGVDSMSLLHLLHSYNLSFAKRQLDITAITINHNYRANSTLEASSITEIISPLGIRHEIIPIKWDADIHLINNFEKLARLKRYELISRYCQGANINKILLGHTFNDQIETFIQRLLANSTIFGLQCMSPVSPIPIPNLNTTLNCIRPLLSVPKQSLYEYCQNNNISWYEDHTNMDFKLTKRNRIRSQLIQNKISTSNVLDLIDQVQQATELMNAKCQNLKRILIENDDLVIDKRFCSIKIKLFYKIFHDNLNEILINRFLWCLNYQISPLPKYHYSYSDKINLFTKIHNAVKKDTSQISFTSLGSIWKIDVNDKTVTILIAREPPRTNEKVSIRGSIVEFDHRFLIKANHAENESYVRLITKKDYRQLKNFKIKNNLQISSSKILNLPCIVDENDEIKGIPTLDTYETEGSYTVELYKTPLL